MFTRNSYRIMEAGDAGFFVKSTVIYTVWAALSTWLGHEGAVGVGEGFLDDLLISQQ